MNSNSFYFDRLNREEKQIYHAIKEGLLSLSPSFPVPLAEPGTFSELFFKVRLDNPGIFWAPSFSYSYVRGAENAEFKPEYLFKKKQVLEHRSAMEARVRKLANAAKSLSDVEKEKYIHDMILTGVKYDKLKKPYSHEIIGPLGQGVGVCEGIAKSVKVLCDAMGIWCIIAVCDNNPDKGIKYRHTWNIIKLGNKYYHLDATFDNSLSACGVQRYDYFNISDSFVFRDHEPAMYPVPECGDSSAAYYAANKLVFTKYEDLKKRIPQFAKKKKTMVFQWRAGYMTAEVIKDIISMFNESCPGHGFRLSINRPQGIFCAEFTDETGSADVSMQEANEGEQL